MSESPSPPVWPTDRETLEVECEITFVKASGPGGQHRNKRETGVRLVHPPSGTVVMATERRSQARNRELAFQRMAARLADLNYVDPERVPTRVPRAAKRKRLAVKKQVSARKASRRFTPTEDGE